MTPTRPGTLNVNFTASPPGLSPFLDFELASVAGAIGLFTLRGREGADLRLFLVDPAVFVPDYRPEFSEDQLAPLGADSTAQLEAFLGRDDGRGRPRGEPAGADPREPREPHGGTGDPRRRPLTAARPTDRARRRLTRARRCRRPDGMRQPRRATRRGL